MAWPGRIRTASRGHRSRRRRLCGHSGLLHLGVLLHRHTLPRPTAVAEAREPPLQRVLDGERGGGGPEHEVERGEDGGRAGGAADGAAAEEQVRQEDGQGDEAGEVEQDVGDLKGKNSPWVGDFETMSAWHGCMGNRRYSHLGMNLGTASR